ncbi:RNA polymerase sigma-70 factor, ECF subfamily [Flavobacterium glycines]|uniref:DNA-directed RNA polymerase sigma-70 factor n=1 Tax=Flavobacterium glycines TaxID=551990 RepID=A0A1B9DRP6_9FLAO|nr:RNA polymerase subunit sigma-24 [Flavobacterium glycines]GEL09826.1 DNA-directed RNA polymerase sigma-70 factor [Flavobacterium glycines]SDI92144.1 RNA polymerase sigma-70 factor, ECF subfamily [Flavobacterium glycines]
MTETKAINNKLLVTELMVGNEKAFSALFTIYCNDVYAYSLSMLKNEVFAEEIVQDVFLNIWLHRDRLNPDLSFKSYVFTITRNLTFNLISKVANSHKLKEEVFYTSQKSYSPIEDIIAEADYDAIKNKAIEQLPPKRRIIFEMSRNREMSYEEISKELNISVSTVKGQMSKALADIRDFLETHGDVALLISLISSRWLE